MNTYTNVQRVDGEGSLKTRSWLLILRRIKTCSFYTLVDVHVIQRFKVRQVAITGKVTLMVHVLNTARPTVQYDKHNNIGQIEEYPYYSKQAIAQ
jgi:hypothetical protein